MLKRAGALLVPPLICSLPGAAQAQAAPEAAGQDHEAPAPHDAEARRPKKPRSSATTASHQDLPADLDRPWDTRPWAVEGRYGLGTPVGSYGLEASYALAPAISLGLGAGVGSGLETGLSLHLAAYGHLRPLRGKRNAWAFDIAYSTGGYREFDGPPYTGLDRAHWVQFGTGWERRAKTGFIIRIMFGIARLLNPKNARTIADDGEWAEHDERGIRHTSIPYVEFAPGMTF